MGRRKGGRKYDQNFGDFFSIIALSTIFLYHDRIYPKSLAFFRPLRLYKVSISRVMASQNNMISKQVMKEGIVQKKSSLLKQWRHRFLVLNPETLCVFKKEEDNKKGRTAKERIFLMDITSLEKTSTKKKKFCLTLIADGRRYVFNCASEIDRELWIRATKNAQNEHQHLEENDPIRRKSMKLTGGLQRVTIERKKGSGLGCTIKSIGGIIFVNRILEHGTVSSSGALRPGET